MIGVRQCLYLGLLGVLWAQDPEPLAVGLLYRVIFITEYAGATRGKREVSGGGEAQGPYPSFLTTDPNDTMPSA